MFSITPRIRQDLDVVTIEGKEYVVGYKVVTEDMRSLGLRNNPNILTFRQGRWVDLSPDKIVPGKADYGGIWLAVSRGNANRLKTYMGETYEEHTRIFRTITRDVLFHNNYRMKTSGVKLLEEIK